MKQLNLPKFELRDAAIIACVVAIVLWAVVGMH